MYPRYVNIFGLNYVTLYNMILAEWNHREVLSVNMAGLYWPTAAVLRIDRYIGELYLIYLITNTVF